MSTPIDFAERRSTVNLKSLQHACRELEAIALGDGQHYMVQSASHPGAYYNVELVPGALAGSCSCPWGQHGGSNCKHVLAALRARYQGEGSLSFWRSREAAERQHRPILQGPGFYATLRRRA